MIITQSKIILAQKVFISLEYSAELWKIGIFNPIFAGLTFLEDIDNIPKAKHNNLGQVRLV